MGNSNLAVRHAVVNMAVLLVHCKRMHGRPSLT